MGNNIFNSGVNVFSSRPQINTHSNSGIGSSCYANNFASIEFLLKCIVYALVHFCVVAAAATAVVATAALFVFEMRINFILFSLEIYEIFFPIKTLCIFTQSCDV